VWALTAAGQLFTFGQANDTPTLVFNHEPVLIRSLGFLA
jgi:hypothetical protein